MKKKFARIKWSNLVWENLSEILTWSELCTFRNSSLFHMIFLICLFICLFIIRNLCYPGDSNRCWRPNLWEQRKSCVQHSPRTAIFLCGLSDRYVISFGNEPVWKIKVLRRKKKRHIMTVDSETHFHGLETGQSSTVRWLKQECGNELQKKDCSNMLILVVILCCQGIGLVWCCKYLC